MIKRDELSSPSSCLNKAEDDEPVFVLRAKDPCAALTIMHWITLRIEQGKNLPGDDQIMEACNLVLKAEEWRRVQS